MKIHRYTKEENAWLTENINLYGSCAEVHQAFIKRFYNVSFLSLTCHCTETLKLHRNNDGRFNKGHKGRELPLLTEKDGQNGVIYIKVKKSKKAEKITSYCEPYWIPKQKYVYEKFYKIKVPKNKYVIFLDGNRNNYLIENLYCINRKISVLMAKNQWYTNNRENTLTAIKLCELQLLLKNQKNNTEEVEK